jgi:hypothetical protein
MRLDEFESKQLKQINKLDKQLNEGLGIGSTILNFLFGGKFKKVVKDAVEDEHDFPEYQAALQDLHYNMEKLETLNTRLKKQRKLLASKHNKK